MKKELHERKWEIDSLCYPIRLAYHFWKKTGDISPFDADWDKAIRTFTKLLSNNSVRTTSVRINSDARQTAKAIPY